MYAVLEIKDVLEGVNINDPPIINVVVIQHGSKEFEIESIEGTDNKELIQLAELVALEKARNTSEDLWDYKLID